MPFARLLSLLGTLAVTTLAAPPTTKRTDHADTLHGVTVADPYRWLESDSAEAGAWVKEQAAYARAHLDKLPGRAAIATRVKELAEVTAGRASSGVGSVVRTGGQTFFQQQDAGQNQPVLYVQTAGAARRVLIDPNQRSPAGITSIGSWSPSPDGKWLAYGTSVAGSDWQIIRVRDTASARDLDDKIEWTKFAALAWTPDSRGFYYSRFPEVAADRLLTAANDFQKVYHHRLETPQSRDELIFERPDQKEWAFSALPMQQGHTLILIFWGTRRQHRISWLDPAAPGKTFDLVSEFEAEFSPIGHLGTVVYFKTSYKAPHGRVIAVDLKAPARDQWREIVPESKDTLQRALVLGNRVLCQYMRDVKSVLSVWPLSGGAKPDHEVSINDIVSAGWGRERFMPSPVAADAGQAFYYTAGFTRPPSLFSYDLKERKSAPLMDSKLPFDPAGFETRQVFYNSKDGTRVPMFLVMRKGLQPDGNTPTLLYGYGGFNLPSLPTYSPRNLAWVEGGGIYAVANLRGGNEYGVAWHRAGALDKKQNVFDDFIAAAEWLIANRYTTSKRLAILGVSNGGLLVGACLNQRPDLFGAAIPAVGVMDMLRFHKFTVGAGWTSDYGSPDNPRDFAVLMKYSPLHNIKVGTKYPPTLIMTADHDDRVVPLHSFKYGATMQYAQEGPAPILLRIETDAGHGGGKPVSKTVEEAADVIAFLRQSLGVQ
ncbi:MAG: S9 family peptidase [Acidobacteria bacterium]|nr:S9 family peptidase [Acidobacteriota bacterium]